MQVLCPGRQPFVPFEDETAVVAQRLLALLVQCLHQTVDQLRTHPGPIWTIPNRPHCTPMHRAVTTSPCLTFPFSQPASTPSIACLIRSPSSTWCAASSLRTYASEPPFLLTPLPRPMGVSALSMGWSKYPPCCCPCCIGNPRSMFVVLENLAVSLLNRRICRSRSPSLFSTSSFDNLSTFGSHSSARCSLSYRQPASWPGTASLSIP